MNDLISRQAAIDAILHITNCKSVRELFEYNQEHHLTEMWSGGVNDAIDAVIGVESATDNNVGTELGTNLAEVGTDCISREQSIKATWQDTGYTDPFNVMTAIRDRIKQLPPIQPKLLQPWEVLAAQAVLSQPAEPKRGKWISADAIFGGVPFYCSECGENTRDTVMGKPRWKFCPMCGAKMEENNESN